MSNKTFKSEETQGAQAPQVEYANYRAVNTVNNERAFSIGFSRYTYPTDALVEKAVKRLNEIFEKAGAPLEVREAGSGAVEDIDW